ncbi:MAG: MASE1 domain-containing protein [Cyanobacteria bacterium J06621_11]
MRVAALSRSKFFYIFGNLALGLAYYGGAELSRWLASTPDNVTPVWPPDGIAVAAVFLYGYAMLPGVCLGSFLANIWAFWEPSSWLSLSSSVLGVFGIALGTTLGTGVGVFTLKQTARTHYPLNRVKHVIQLLLFAGMVGPVINAIAGVAVLCSLGIVPWSAYGQVWLTWWISNVAGIFIVTPAAISWTASCKAISAERPKFSSSMGSSKHFTIRNFAEPLLMIGITVAVGGGAFWHTRNSADLSHSLDYMLIPLLIWPTFRYGHRGATFAAVGISTIAILGTVRGLGSFTSDDLNTSLTLLQSFIAVTVFTALVVASVLAERTTAEDKLRQAIADLATANQDLEQRVQARTQELDTKNKRLESTLSDLHAAQTQLVQSEKMSGLGQMVAGIAHEINNPVNFIHGNLKHLSDYVTNLVAAFSRYQHYYPDLSPELENELETLDVEFIQEDAPKILGSMTTGTERIREIVLSLRNFSRLDESALKQANIHDGIESTLLILQHRLKLTKTDDRSIQLVRDYGTLPLVECYPGLLNQAFMNILSNAIDALQDYSTAANQEEKPTITIRTTIVEQLVRIAIADNGPGIDEDTKSKIFDPFFTTKPIGKGTGMGLSISYQIVTQKHNGTFTFESSPGNGTAFVIQIPLQSSSR